MYLDIFYSPFYLIALLTCQNRPLQSSTNPTVQVKTLTNGSHCPMPIAILFILLSTTENGLYFSVLRVFVSKKEQKCINGDRSMKTDCTVQKGPVLQKAAYCIKLLSVVITGYVHAGPWNEVLTAWSRTLLRKLTVPKLVKKFSTVYRTRRFVTVYTRSHQMPLTEPGQSSPRPPSRFI